MYLCANNCRHKPLNELKQSHTPLRAIMAIVCSLVSCVLWAQSNNEAHITQMLKEEGFEDIRVKLKTDTLFAAVEDHAHRGSFRGAAKAIQLTSQEIPEIQHFEILLTDYKIPQVIVHASKREGIWYVAVDREMKQARQLLRDEATTASSTGKIDITIFPMVTLVNNKLDHLFDYTVRIAPAVAITPWKGGRITIQPIFPILYRLPKGDPKHYIQMGSTNLSQQFFSSKRWQLSAAAGFFHMERPGIQARLTFHALPGLDLMLEAGQTAEAYVHKGGFHFGALKQTDVMARADYYEPHTRLQIELEGGRFPYGDYGARLDVTRHFGEYAIGVYGIHTGGENNAGFHFAIPVGAKRQRRTHFLRLRLPEYYSLEYSMSSYYKYTLENMGLSYVTQPDQNRAAHYWEPAFIQEYVERLLNGTFK